MMMMIILRGTERGEYNKVLLRGEHAVGVKQKLEIY